MAKPSTYQPRHHFIVILCGGTGPRLWPLSRAKNPKPFLALLGRQNLLQQTFNRAKHVVPTNNIYLVTNKKYGQKIKNLLPTKNIINEPEKKNTAMAILYATSFIQKVDQKAIITVLPSDHFVDNLDNFQKDLAKMYLLAQAGHIATIGIPPAGPNPSYGYIKTTPIKDHFKVIKFIEKPTIKKAKQLILNPHCFWNAGIYTFSPVDLIVEFEKYQNQYLPLYRQLCQKQLSPKIIKHLYSLSPNLSIDYAIAEKSANIVLIKASFLWSDIGQWNAIYLHTPHDPNGNASINNQTDYLALNSSHCLVHSPHKLIGLVGVRDLAIIDTADALLICHLDSSFEVRQLIGLMVNDKRRKQYFLS